MQHFIKCMDGLKMHDCKSPQLRGGMEWDREEGGDSL